MFLPEHIHFVVQNSSQEDLRSIPLRHRFWWSIMSIIVVGNIFKINDFLITERADFCKKNLTCFRPCEISGHMLGLQILGKNAILTLRAISGDQKLIAT